MEPVWRVRIQYYVHCRAIIDRNHLCFKPLTLFCILLGQYVHSYKTERKTFNSASVSLISPTISNYTHTTIKDVNKPHDSTSDFGELYDIYWQQFGFIITKLFVFFKFVRQLFWWLFTVSLADRLKWLQSLWMIVQQREILSNRMEVLTHLLMRIALKVYWHFKNRQNQWLNLTN